MNLEEARIHHAGYLVSNIEKSIKALLDLGFVCQNVPYHICFAVDDMNAAIDELKEHGYLLFKDIQRATAISDTANVVFLIHTSVGMVELLCE